MVVGTPPQIGTSPTMRLATRSANSPDGGVRHGEALARRGAGPSLTLPHIGLPHALDRGRRAAPLRLTRGGSPLWAARHSPHPPARVGNLLVPSRPRLPMVFGRRRRSLVWRPTCSAPSRASRGSSPQHDVGARRPDRTMGAAIVFSVGERKGFSTGESDRPNGAGCDCLGLP
jgi:hypothetical protein